MKIGNFSYPMPVNEPVLTYAPWQYRTRDSKMNFRKRQEQTNRCSNVHRGEDVPDQQKKWPSILHMRKTICLVIYYRGNATNVKQAIDAALAAKETWAA